MPTQKVIPPNFFNCNAAIQKCRTRFLSEVKNKRMLGGVGWSLNDVKNFLGREVYVIPCGAVPKNNDPHGRIIHNYSYPSKKSGSINAALINTSVSYISFKNRVAQLSKVDWYIKADLKNGYRQLPVHPTDWHTQIYSLGPNEFYIDIAMPFGKANSSKVFCTWTSAWCNSFKFHFQNQYSAYIILLSYVDDFFGGPIRTGALLHDKKIAKLMLENIIVIGEITNTCANLEKCKEPARRMVILGIMFDSIKKSCYLAHAKISKYCNCLTLVRTSKTCTSKLLQKIIGYLVFASWVIPYGRPFISHISFFIDNQNLNKKVILDSAGLMACDIWLTLLNKNCGLPFSFIMGSLPRQKDEWFYDASTSYGYGGICGNLYFRVSHREIISLVGETFARGLDALPIAYRELLAALFAFQAFAKNGRKKFIRVNSDNTNTVTWLNKGRCSKKFGFLILSAIEYYKFKYGLKIKAYYIKSSHNTSADALSRGLTPKWLLRRGVRQKIDVSRIVNLLKHPLPFWLKSCNPF